VNALLKGFMKVAMKNVLIYQKHCKATRKKMSQKCLQKEKRGKSILEKI
jgi:hypothetical protein